MSPAIILAIAMVLDAVFGEPDWLWRRLPHPAVLMGRAVAGGDARFNKGEARRFAGTVFMAGLALGAIALGYVLTLLPFGWLIETLVVAVLIAQRSLTEHVSAVARALEHGLPDARRTVAMIVGRDTAAMDEPAIARAAIESAAENLSDGVVAPALWYLVLGLPGILLYKVTNTADSMIGHRTERHEAFGWAAARFDDLLNLIPARLTALVLALLSGTIAEWRGIVRDARAHRSPNAGWPEAAMARALGVALSGPRSYDGQMRDFPYVFPEGDRAPGAASIDAAVRRLWHVWAVLLLGVLALSLAWW